MVTANGQEMFSKKGMGLVGNVFTQDSMKSLIGHMGIGHNRYSTAGKSDVINCQPFVVDTVHGRIAVAHNGELVNAKSLRQRVLKHGIGLSSDTDSELIIQLMVSEPPCGEPNGPRWGERIKNLMALTTCAYSVVMLTKDGLYGVRDPFGNRPLCIGKLDVSAALDTENGKRRLSDASVFILSSESCAFHSIGANLVRDVLPGEIVKLTEHGVESIGFVERKNRDSTPAFCIFEYVYFARADTIFEGQLVYEVRKNSGRQLALEAPTEADIVSTVPESATPSAFGYSEQSGIPYKEVFVKNRYVGRTFIQPSNRLRKLGVATKFGPLIDNFKGKRVILLDDSIVRGHTMGPIVQLLKAAGAKEVHIRVASPPIKHPCFMGINIPTTDELIANHMNADQLAVHLGADSLVYLSVDGLKKAVQQGITGNTSQNVGHCTACLTGEYPVELEW
eukprot:Seg53.4 transcript_id=Seg53.4/GoldUCD/mRNA.D3Y31 product=Amidophosphoribosyltransferase protein_id=Seg53.4/GoldUCD/D3Y31